MNAPNYRQITVLLVVDLCSSLAYFMMTQPLPIAGKLPIKTLVARQLPTRYDVCVYMYVCVHAHVCVCVCMYVCVDMCVYVCVHTCVCVCVHIHAVHGTAN